MVFFVVVDVVEMKWLKYPCKHEARAIQVNLGNSIQEIKPIVIEEKEEGNVELYDCRVCSE